MRISTLLRRNLTHYWRTNLAVVAGAAIAVAVLAGAAMVGDSVRASLRDLVLGRLGNTETVISGAGFFREELAAEFGSACPLLALEGVVAHDNGRRAYGVAVYGVDERFWKFHGRDPGRAPAGRMLLMSDALARELGAQAGDSVVVRVDKRAAIPAESLHGRKEEAVRSIRFATREVLSAADLGEFSLRPGQGAVRAVFVSLQRLQRDLEQSRRINTILISGGTPAAQLEKTLQERFSLEDLGIRVRLIDQAMMLETDSAIVNDSLVKSATDAATSMGMKSAPVFTYLANTIRVAGREVPYSLVTACATSDCPADSGDIVLNDWAARDLAAKPGDTVSLEYYVWNPDGRITTGKVQFRLAAIVPTRDERHLAPDYPGLTNTESLHDWDPPFPIDLGRVRPRDEEYWKKYRTTPKAFIAIQKGQELWQSRFGKMTSLQLTPANPQFSMRLRERLNPLQAGFTVQPVRAAGLAAAQGSTDFGEYFLYFSFFLVLSAVLLVGLFFKLGIEQRSREIGLLRALGFSTARIYSLFLSEGVVLSAIGGLLGSLGAAGYAAFILYGLRTWWIDAVGTRMISLHLAPGSLAMAAVGGVLTAVISIALALLSLRKMTPRGLMAESATRSRSRLAPAIGIACAVAALGLTAGAAAGAVGQAAGFFGAGMLLLSAFLLLQWTWLRARTHARLDSVIRLGFRNATYRPGRSVLCIALIAFATFLIVSLDAFRREEADPLNRASGTGGYPLVAESALPVYQTAGTPFDQVSHARFRLRPGDDASCLNLYQPRNPRLLAPTASFLRDGRFSFQGSLARSEAEKRNPWLLLETPSTGGAIPAIADANSLAYSLHRKLGDVIELDNGVRLRIVGALRDSIFQSELIISEAAFVRAFPNEQGYRLFLVDAPPAKTVELTTTLEDTFSDQGLDVTSTAERLAAFHRVENTYLSTFQMLGGMGLLLGTAGLGIVLLRNVLEMRRELALLQAVGFRTAHLAAMVVAGDTLLLAAGLGAGTVCAAVAVAPALAARGGNVAPGSIALLLVAVLVTGLLASLAAIGAVTRSPLLPALKSE